MLSVHLGATSESRIVESESKDFDTAYVEDFQKAAFEAANDRLLLQGGFELEPFFDEQGCIRGRGAARCLFRMDKGILVPDITPWDSRFVYYSIGRSGLDWAAYETIRSKADIKAEYGIVIEGEDAPILDVWDTKHNEVWMGTELIKEQKYNYGFTPVVIRIVTLGSMLVGKDALSRQGESIFFLIREAIPELNRVVSIMQTLNLKSVKPPMKQKRKGGGQASDYDDVTDMGTITPMEPEEDVLPIDYGDAKRAASIAYNIMQRSLEEGSLSSVDLGIIGSPPPSAIALIQIKEGRDQVFTPRLKFKSQMKEGLADMFTEQVLQIGGTVELGVKGHKRKFQTSKLKGEYTTTYSYHAKSLKVDAGLYTLAAAAGNLIPDVAKRRDILQREDPDEDERQLRWEEAERLSPAIKMNRTIRNLMEMAERGDKDAILEAELMSAEMGMNLKQMLTGQMTQMPKPEKKQEPKQVVSMFGGAEGRPRQPVEEGET